MRLLKLRAQAQKELLSNLIFYPHTKMNTRSRAMSEASAQGELSCAVGAAAGVWADKH